MRDEIKSMAGINEEVLPRSKNKNLSRDLIKDRAGIEYSNNIVIKESKDVDKIYIELLEVFEEDTESINKIKEIFSKVVKI